MKKKAIAQNKIWQLFVFFKMSLILIYRVTNACGVTESRTIVHTVAQMSGRIIDCDGFNGKVELNVYPNPVKSDITALFKVNCQDCTSEELENSYPQLDENTTVTLSDGFGNIHLHYEGKQIPLDINGNIYLHLAKLPVGNYVLKVITTKEVFWFSENFCTFCYKFLF